MAADLAVRGDETSVAAFHGLDPSRLHLAQQVADRLKNQQKPPQRGTVAGKAHGRERGGGGGAANRSAKTQKNED